MGRGAMQHLGFGSHEEESSGGFGDKMCQAIGGVCVGLLLFLGALAVLGWNEKRAVYTAQTIDFARTEFVQLDTCEPAAANDGKLIAFQGCGPTAEQGYDPTNYEMLKNVVTSTGAGGQVFVPLPPGSTVFSWARHTQQYVYHEIKVTTKSKSKSKTKSKSKSKVSYKYEPEWRSSAEHYHSGVSSPPGWPVGWGTASGSTSLVCIGSGADNDTASTGATACTTTNTDSWLLDSSLSWDRSQIGRMGDTDKVALTDYAKVTTTLMRGTTRFRYNVLAYRCSLYELQTEVNPYLSTISHCKAQAARAPSTLGDFRFTFTRKTSNKDYVVSGLALQTSKGKQFGLGEWQNPDHSGCSYCTIGTITSGSKTGDTILDELESANKMITWILRFVGWLVCWVGLQMVVGPIAVVPEFIPVIGDIIGGIIGSILCCLTCLVATSLSMLVIAIAWLAFRPLLAIPLLLVCCLGCVASGFFIKRQRGRKSSKASDYVSADPINSPMNSSSYQPADQYPMQDAAYPPQTQNAAGNPYAHAC